MDVFDGNQVVSTTMRCTWHQSSCFFDAPGELGATMPWCTIDVVPQLNPKKPRFNGCLPNGASAPHCYKTRNEKLRSRHAVHLRNGEIITKFHEACESSSIVFKGPWKHTA